MKTQPYITPPGYYDLPFTWAFDASGLVNGTSPQANSIYLLGGYGDFIARRAVGFNRILDPATGTFRINGPSRADYLSSDPIYGANSPESAILNEQLYPETGLIRFDLNNVLLPAAPLTSQIAFQGVRREKGSFQRNPAYKAFPKSFTYQLTAQLTQVASAGVAVSAFLPIDDYDFELHDMILMSASGSTRATLLVATGEVLNFLLTAVAPGVGGNSISFEVISSAPTPNVPFSYTVVGNVITTNCGTTALGFNQSLSTFIANLQAVGAFNALVTIGPPFGGLAGPTAGFATAFLSGGSGGSGSVVYQPITSPVCSLSVYDSNKVKISNIPILDIFYNGGPGSPYENGALVPPLWYPKDTVLQVDFYSQITNPALLPTEIVLYLVGKQYIPC
jgi:hypothetical protein